MAIDREKQKLRQQKWIKENMKRINLMYKKELMEEFNEACKILGKSKSALIKEAIEKIIKKSKKVDKISKK